MVYQDLEPRLQLETGIDLAGLMDTLLAGKVMLLRESERKNLKGIPTTIDYVSPDTNTLEEVGFTIFDGATFMWDRRHPAAVVYGRIHGTNDLLITGGIFDPNSLRRTAIDPYEIDFFPALIGEVPGHLRLLDDAIAFRISPRSSNILDLTVGGRYPESRITTQIPARNNSPQIQSHLNLAVKAHIPRPL